MRIFIKNTNTTIIQHIYHEANEAADWMARISHTIPHHVTWKSSPSSSFFAILVADNLGKILLF